MEIVAQIKNSEDDENQFQVIVTEEELDKITGVHGKSHIDGRYTAGKNIGISQVYGKMKKINENYQQIKQGMKAAQSAAKAIEDSLPIIEGE